MAGLATIGMGGEVGKMRKSVGLDSFGYQGMAPMMANDSPPGGLVDIMKKRKPTDQLKAGLSPAARTIAGGSY